MLLLVNTASECGFTSQYAGLEKLWRDYRDRGLVVIGFPRNQFGAQEPGSGAEIAQFCEKNYGVSFPMTEKVLLDPTAAGHGWFVDSSPDTDNDVPSGKMDLLTVVMHELGHLLAYEHSEDPDGLMAPVLAGSPLGSSGSCSGLSTLDSRPSTFLSSEEAVEPLRQAEWRTPLDYRRASDDVFAQLGRDDLAQDGSADGMSQWLESENGDPGRTAIATSPSRQTPQLRLPRRSRG